MFNDKVLFKGTNKADRSIEMDTRMIVEQYKRRNDLIQQVRETKQLQIVGNSMCPVLDPRKISTIFLSFCGEYRVGDVIAFEYRYSIVGISVHRIIKKSGDAIFTKGDNNIKCDKAIDVSKIIGKVESALTNKSNIVPIKTSIFIAMLSRIENRLVEWLPKRLLDFLHSTLRKIYVLLS